MDTFGLLLVVHLVAQLAARFAASGFPVWLDAERIRAWVEALPE
jgi:hypothetical protein